jgi:hypothetical protein
LDPFREVDVEEALVRQQVQVLALEVLAAVVGVGLHGVDLMNELRP